MLEVVAAKLRGGRAAAGGNAGTRRTTPRVCVWREDNAARVRVMGANNTVMTRSRDGTRIQGKGCVATVLSPRARPSHGTGSCAPAGRAQILPDINANQTVATGPRPWG